MYSLNAESYGLIKQFATEILLVSVSEWIKMLKMLVFESAGGLTENRRRKNTSKKKRKIRKVREEGAWKPMKCPHLISSGALFKL